VQLRSQSEATESVVVDLLQVADFIHLAVEPALEQLAEEHFAERGHPSDRVVNADLQHAGFPPGRRQRRIAQAINPIVPSR
jgi:hypothetical protein